MPSESSAEQGQASAAPPKAGLFLQAPFLKLFSGSFLGCLADRLYQMAVIAALQQAFGQATKQLAWVTLIGVLAQFLLYPIVGTLVDARDRRRLLWGVCAIKAPLVMVLLPILWQYQQAWFLEHWNFVLAGIFLLATVSVPFGPARASAIPDVVGGPQLSLAASLVAVSGLGAILAGSPLGSTLATYFGPPWVLPVVTALYLAAAALLRGLPDAVAVPGTQRGKAEGVPAPSSAGTPLERLRDYLRANWEGLCYVKSRRGIPSLILFETLFWTTGVAFYILLEWQATGTLFLDHRGHQLYFGYALGSAGAGLFAGAILSGRISRHVSPLFTYPPAVFLIGLGMAQVLGARGAWSPLADSAALEANFALALELLPWAGLMVFGGALLMGRIDADLLAVAEASMRGRVFSIKGFFFTGALLLPLLLFLFDLPDDVFLGLAHHLPRGLMWAALAVLPLSWFLDCGIYAGRTGKPIVGVQERLFYRFARLIAWLISKLYFRMTVVGLERIPKEGPVLLAANHGSFLDPFWAGCALPRVIKYIMHASYYNSLAHPFFRLLMTIPVDTSSNIRALKAGTEALKEGYCVVMFPEGHVSDDGKLQKPKAGVLFLAQRAGAPVIPVAIQGNTRAYPRWFKIPRPRKITLLIGEPFSVPKDASRREVAELTDRLMRTLAEMLNLEPPPACVDDVPERGKAGEAQP